MIHDTTRRLAWIRSQVIRMSYKSNAAHLGSSLSCIELLDAILAVSNLKPSTVNSADRDRLIVSKGHAAMACYATLAAYDLLPLQATYEYLQNGSSLWGHVTCVPDYPAIDYSTGSLGHGLGLACGHAYGYRLRCIDSTLFVLMSDGECNEGSVWEAAWFAGHHGLSNIKAIIDYNKIQSLDFCERVLRPEPFLDKWKAFGWKTFDLDGHAPGDLRKALTTTSAQPCLYLCHTVKGKGIPRIENTIESHYKPALEHDFIASKDVADA